MRVFEPTLAYFLATEVKQIDHGLSLNRIGTEERKIRNCIIRNATQEE